MVYPDFIHTWCIDPEQFNAEDYVCHKCLNPAVNRQPGYRWENSYIKSTTRSTILDMDMKDTSVSARTQCMESWHQYVFSRWIFFSNASTDMGLQIPIKTIPTMSRLFSFKSDRNIKRWCEALSSRVGFQASQEEESGVLTTFLKHIWFWGILSMIYFDIFIQEAWDGHQIVSRGVRLSIQLLVVIRTWLTMDICLYLRPTISVNMLKFPWNRSNTWGRR